MRDRIIGIIGGMGPEATADLYREIIRLTPAKKDQDHIKVLIYSNPKIPDRSEAILSGGESPLPHLVETARVLMNGGAGILAIPCNAAHYFHRELLAAVKFPILNMIEESHKALARQFGKLGKIGLLAASGTVRSRVYHKYFESRDVDLLVPVEDDQARVHSAIQAVKAGQFDDDTSEAFESAGNRLVESGAQAVILGCTEIPLVFRPDRVTYCSLNATRALAQAAVDWALETV